MQPTPLVAPPTRRQPPYRPLVLVAAAFCVGAIVDRFAVSQGPSWVVGAWWTVAAIGLAGALLADRQGRAQLSIGLLLLAAAGDAGAWSRIRWNWFADDDLGRFAREESEPACVEVTLLETPEVSPAPPTDPLRATQLGAMSQATVRVLAIRDGRDWRPASGTARLRIAGELKGVGSGDQLRLFARLGQPYPTLNPGQYDWAGAERSSRRLCEVYCPNVRCVSIVSSAQQGVLSRLLGDLRRWSQRQLASNIHWGDARLPLAVLLGEREQLSDETTDAFVHTGTVHLLVVSGLHVGMVAGVVWWFAGLASLSLRGRVVVTIGFVLVYAAIVGASPPVMRATVLVVLFLTALASGRRTTPLNLLAAALIVVLAYNPAELFRSGTQLSFLSVGALMIFGRWVQRPRTIDPLKRLLAGAAPWYRKAARRAGRDLALMSIASLIVWLTAAPLVAYHFHLATPIGVLITPIIWPLVAVALAAGIGVATFGWLIPPVAQVCGALCGGGLHVTQRIVQWADATEIGYYHTVGPQWWWVCGWYGGMVGLCLAPSLRPRTSRLLALACLWIAVSFASDGWRRSRADRQLTCTFLAVGHGTCVVLELPGGQTLLYDAGSLGSPSGAARTISSFLWSRRINKIDALVISHADVDHYNAVPRLLKLMPIEMVFVSPMMFDPLTNVGQLTAPNYLREVLEREQIELGEIWLGDHLRTRSNEVAVEVLHPPRTGVLGRDNANSLLLAVSFGGRRVLLPGDLESPGIEAVMSDPPVDCDILLAPHHGSAASDPPGFARWSTPEWLVLSGGRRSRSETAAQTYTRAGAQALHTARSGAVSFCISDGRIAATSFRSGEARGGR